MVLIPLRGSGTRGDQVENARLFEEAGAAICFIPDEDAGDAAAVAAPAKAVAAPAKAVAKLSALIASLAEDPERRKAMGEAEVAKKDAAAFIAGEIISRIADVELRTRNSGGDK